MTYSANLSIGSIFKTEMRLQQKYNPGDLNILQPIALLRQF
jgi:hypothetical protein